MGVFKVQKRRITVFFGESFQKEINLFASISLWLSRGKRWEKGGIKWKIGGREGEEPHENWWWWGGEGDVIDGQKARSEDVIWVTVRIRGRRRGTD